MLRQWFVVVLAAALVAAVSARGGVAAAPPLRAAEPVPSLAPAATAKLWRELVRRPRARRLANSECAPLRAVFYAATLLAFLWLLNAAQRHELAELQLREVTAESLAGPAPALSENLVARWERQSSQFALFLVVALPIAFSPALGAHLVLTDSVTGDTALMLPAVCFALAALFHVWGTALLVSLYNSHLRAEAEHAGDALARPRAAPQGTAARHEVFVSHSASDKQAAEAICRALEAAGVNVWIAPRDILPGVTWGEAIIDAITGARVMLVLFSASSNASPQVLREVERAVGKGLAVVPVRIENVVPSKAMEYFLSSPHWLDAIEPPIEQHLERIVRTIRTLIDAADPALHSAA